MIEIREYRESDQENLVGLIRELQASEVILYDRMKPVAQMGVWYVDLLKKKCAEDEGVILIAEENGAALGYAVILTRSAEDGTGDEVAYDYAYIIDLVVAKEARRRGIGKLLLADCERRARDAGRDDLRITVLAANQGAHDLYRALGFDDLLINMRKGLT
ncbi:GNAT family N-acetyltransferase [Aestuariivirga sp. YIM B02566]|uniref:GNAT family N-acetyltransferase n=1 Tax=Taklimakanibacter albus TaxID=2800327 RepID=A0ACC5QXZ4_9HYPH|nr:GNAT family N-acetyltransferase [Aestuariivirga sp. YIM B02566]MBK1865086.1 GNAT family N-acetyltransferase [Aestuariivirga sp. YIM B02566]